ncbi:neuropeptide CCHamide-2-like isoform X1 [Stegodyphus dumicola]|uniref:neuropeptide CCHamide-2-like isoform X1 n=1 Tax=Stegodyphus dumicola TaxID=202533 RepID=UPI0015A893AF|nr:neuropeptide CCHamide-2-like isoform X1 [Stegodyphus dumicola]
MTSNRVCPLALAAILTFAYFETVSAGGSCQSYGHSCLGGHGKRNNEQLSALQLLLQQALKGRDQYPLYDYRLPERDTYDILRSFTDLKVLEDKTVNKNE